MSEYTLEKEGTLNIDTLLKNIKSTRDLFGIDCAEDTDNIAVLKTLFKMMYQRILELESRVKNLERK